jgi:hypothetical protein
MASREETVEKLWGDFWVTSVDGTNVVRKREFTQAIKEAMDDERERCAKIAENAIGASRREIAAAIREGREL